ncbi:MAG: alpha-1,2-fucosyltransferase [Bacteroidia bacterium]
MKRIIISKCSGQFGNQLWMFANVLVFALENRRQVHAPSFYKFAPLFQYWDKSKRVVVPAQQSKAKDYTTFRKLIYRINRFNFLTNTFLNINLEPVALISKIRLKGKTVPKENLRSYTRCYFDREEYQWLVQKILSRKTVMFQGFMFCSGVEQMKKHQAALQEIFKPAHTVVDKMKWLQEQRPADAFMIGVHIRRGDYRKYRDGKYFYDHEVYKKFMRHVISLFPYSPITFFICSDEKINENDFSEFQIVLNKNGNSIEDMYLLSVCQYIMGPPSTFSKWSSYYGNVPLFIMEDDSTMPVQTDFKVKYNHYY